MNISNPWVGLESYVEGEIIYGRDNDILELSQYVLNDTATLLYGKSGIGKSSILNAGILPSARRHGFLPIPLRLSHKGEYSYLDQIKNGIYNAILQNRDESQDEEKSQNDCIRVHIPPKLKNRESIYEFFHRCSFYDTSGNRLKLLIIFDQFEEIFTLQEDRLKIKSFFHELADMLNDIMPNYLQRSFNEKAVQPVDKLTNEDYGSLFDDIDLDNYNLPDYINDNVIHFVFTIREDFLSEFEFHTSVIPSLKQNRYALRPINEEQAAQIILRPIPGLIDKSVAELIIRNITGRTDFALDGIPEIDVDSALLSLYLNRLYDACSEDVITRELVEKEGISIISGFYDDAIQSISESTIEFLEDKLLTGEGRRDNITKYDAVHVGHVTAEEIDILCNKKKILRQFNYAGQLRIEFVHDILCPIVQRHKKQRILKREQEEEKRKLEREKQELLLQEELKRKAIEKQVGEEKKRLKEESIRIREKNKKRVYTITSVIGILALVFFLIWWNDYNENERPHIEYYSSFETVKGWPVGVGAPLSHNELGHYPLYYKLSHKGQTQDSHHTNVQVMSSNKVLSDNCRIPLLEWSEDCTGDKRSRYFNEILKKVTEIHYSSIGTTSNIGKETFFDKDGKILMTKNYFHLSEDDAWILYYTPSGNNMKIRDNGLDRKKISWDTLGHIKALMYYDSQGIPQRINKNKDIFGYLWQRKGKDTCVVYDLNEFGIPTRGERVNTIVSINRNDTIEKKYLVSSKIGAQDAVEAINDYGFSREIITSEKISLYEPSLTTPVTSRSYKHDVHGNVIEIHTIGHKNIGFPNHIYYTYNEDGMLVKEVRLNEHDQPFVKDSLSFYKWEFCKTKDSIVEKRYNVNGLAYLFKKTRKKLSQDTITHTTTYELDRREKLIIQIDSAGASSSSVTFFGEGFRPINVPKVLNIDTVYLHRIKVRESEGAKEYEYYVYEDGDVRRLKARIDDEGRAQSYFRRIDRIDDSGNITSYRIEDEDDQVIKSMMYFIQNGQVIGKAAMGIEGYPVRCNKWEEEGYLYYKYYFNRDFEQDLSSVAAVDEWENRSIFFDPFIKRDYFYEIIDLKGHKIIVKPTAEESAAGIIQYQTTLQKSYKQIINTSDPEKTNFMMPYIHVLSAESSLYNHGNGVKDGDRIIEFQDWKLTNGSRTSMKNLRSKWESSLSFDDEKSSSNKQVRIVVLRPDGSKYTRLEFTFDLGIDELKKIEFHVTYLSKDEKKFYEDNTLSL